jgi:dTDP-3-amino-3,4,6-trideoxy-alpha-D-glucose transaminase
MPRHYTLRGDKWWLGDAAHMEWALSHVSPTASGCALSCPRTSLCARIGRCCPKEFAGRIRSVDRRRLLGKAKNLGAMGDGGAILNDSPQAADKARSLRDYGQTHKYHHGVTGYNRRLDELQAAYLNRVLLPRLNGWTARRRVVAARYCREIRNPRIRCIGPPPGSDSTWHLFPVLVEPDLKPQFIEYLWQCGVQTDEHYPLALTQQEVLRHSNIESESRCPEAMRFCRHAETSLPIHSFLFDDEIPAVVD